MRRLTLTLALVLTVASSAVAQRLDGGVRINGALQGTPLNNPIFTGQWTVNAVLCATNTVLQGGSPTTCSPAPNVEGFVLTGGATFTQTGQVSAWSYSTVSNQLAIAVNGNAGLTTIGAFILRLRKGDFTSTIAPIQIPNSGSGASNLYLAQDSSTNIGIGIASTTAVTPKFYLKGQTTADLVNVDASSGLNAFTIHGDSNGNTVIGGNLLVGDNNRLHNPIATIESLGDIRFSGSVVTANTAGGLLNYSISAGTFNLDVFGKDASTNGLWLFRSRRSDGTNSVSAATLDGAGNFNALASYQVNGAAITQGTTLLSSGSGMGVANVGANSCGTTVATIAGNNNVSVTTVGATAATQCRIAFTFAATTEWDCTASDDTTTIAVRTTPVDTTHTDLIGTFTANDKVTAICFPR